MGLLLVVLGILLVELALLEVLFPGDIVGLRADLMVVLDLVSDVGVGIYSCLNSCVGEGIRGYQGAA